MVLNLENKKSTNGGNLGLAGNLTRQLEQEQALELDSGVNLETNHLINLGQLVENWNIILEICYKLFISIN